MAGKILYWHGYGRKECELKKFRESLSEKGFSLAYVPENYDEGLILPQTWDFLKSRTFDWWLGISLGASVMAYSLRFLPKEFYPSRMTFINPFYSRRELSQENGFDISNQMDFCLDEAISGLVSVELVLSVYDDKIKMSHGIRCLNHFSSSDKKIIFVNSGHSIQNEAAQVELAQILSSETVKNEKKHNYCDIYHQL